MILSNLKCIDIYKGDTGNIRFFNLPKDKNYSVYFSIFDSRTNEIKAKFLCDEFHQDTGVALLVVDTTKSNSLPEGTFDWSLKICADGMEDTIVPEIKNENGYYFRQEAPKIKIRPTVNEGVV